MQNLRPTDKMILVPLAKEYISVLHAIFTEILRDVTAHASNLWRLQQGLASQLTILGSES